MTVDAIIDYMGFGRFNAKIFFIIGMFWLMEGIEITLITLVTPLLQCQWKISNFQTAIMTSAVFLGMGIGAVYWGWLADKYGRKTIILTSSIFILYFGILTSAAVSFVWFVLIRIFVGIGVGGIACGICYLVEFTPTTHRSKAVIGAQLFFAFGNIFAALMSYFIMNRFGWKCFVISCTLPVLLVIALVQRLPESIRYLQNTGNRDAIMKVLSFLSTENNITLPENVIIQCAVCACGRLKTLIQKQYRRNFVVLVILWMTASGAYYGIVFLNTQMLQMRMFSTHNTTSKHCYVLKDADYLQNILVVLGEIPGIIFYMVILERLGRKKSLILAFVTTSICLFLLTFPLTFKIATMTMFLARATSTSLTQILYIYTSEIFPTVVRTTSLGFCSGMARCSIALIPFLESSLIKTSFGLLVALLSTITFLSSLLCFLLPETTGEHLLNR